MHEQILTMSKLHRQRMESATFMVTFESDLLAAGAAPDQDEMFLTLQEELGRVLAQARGPWCWNAEEEEDNEERFRAWLSMATSSVYCPCRMQSGGG